MVAQATDQDSTSANLAYELRFKKIAKQIHAATNLNEIMISLREEMTKLFEVDRMSIYLVDTKNKEIFSRVKTGKFPQEIRIPINSNSIAGFVAATGRAVNIPDVYDTNCLLTVDPDLHFDKSWDEKLQYKTKQVLAVPILFKKKLLGVIQLINRNNNEPFSPDDERQLSDISETLGIAFTNQYRHSARTPLRYEPLVKNGSIAEKDMAMAIKSAHEQRLDIERVLINDFKISKTALGNSLAEYYGVPFVKLEEDSAYNPLELLKGINIEYFKKALWVPLAREDKTIIIAINDPNDQDKIQEIRQVYRTGSVELRLALKDDIIQFISLHQDPYKSQDDIMPDKSMGDILEEMKEDETPGEGEEEEGDSANVNDSAVVLLVNKIIEDAYVLGASDIHIEPYGLKLDAVVRYRTDGRCANVLTVPKTHIKAVVARFKILSKLDISERRKPQDGKIKFKTSKGKNIELRVATIPTANNNEDVVLRVLAASEPLPLAKIMPASTFNRFTGIIQRPYGIVLVVGPTGSGKTTTLHSALGFINTPERKIWTAEDPVEITQYGLRQVQVQSKIGYTFAAAMRAFLRADPDVIMVGEMRDKETVSMGIEASLTGHLVFSTLHTNSAPETITRLVDMGMDPFNFADALLGILAQRLMRTLCSACKADYNPDQPEYDHLKAMYGTYFDERVNIPLKDLKLKKAASCEVCGNTGYKGRMGLYELLVASDAMKKLIVNRALVEEIKKQAVKEGMIPLLQDGISKIFAGNTDLNQVMSVCSQ